MRRIASLAIAMGLFMAIASTAFADSPHFISDSASIDGSGNLVCSFKEAGLGSTLSTESITCSANATATYACVNGGGNHPKAANKESVTGLVSASGNFPVRNGQTTGSLTVSPPPAGPFSPACNPPMTVVLISVCYSNITLTGLAGDTANLGSQCASFPL